MTCSKQAYHSCIFNLKNPTSFQSQKPDFYFYSKIKICKNEKKKCNLVILNSNSKLSLIPPMNFSSAKLWRRLLLSVFISKCLQNLPHLFSKQTPRRLGRYCIVIELHFAKWSWWRHWLVRKSISTCIFAHRTFARLVIWKTSKGFFCEKWAEYKQCQGSYFSEEKKKITSSSVQSWPKSMKHKQ